MKDINPFGEPLPESKVALEVKEDGQIWLIPNCPVEPEYCTDFGDVILICGNTFCKCDSQLRGYRHNLGAAERYLVSNQEVALDLLFDFFGKDIFPSPHNWDVKPGIYPIPDLKWEVKWMNKKGGVSDKPEAYKVAVISLPEPDKEQRKKLLIEMMQEDEKNGMYEDIKSESPLPHGFCETPGSKCTMSYCDENGCNDRKRVLIEPSESPLIGEKELTALEVENLLREFYTKNKDGKGGGYGIRLLYQYASQSKFKPALIGEPPMDYAIKEFERLKAAAPTLKDALYLDGVLAVLDAAKKQFKSSALIGERSAEPTDETLAIEVMSRFTGNSRGTPIAKKAFIDGVLWARGLKATRINQLESVLHELVDGYQDAETLQKQYELRPTGFDFVKAIIKAKQLLAGVESKEDNKAFGEQDLREAFETGNQLGWCKIPKTFEQWISDRKTK